MLEGVSAPQFLPVPLIQLRVILYPSQETLQPYCLT